MPVYNGAHYLRAALDSCLTQTVVPDEIIVVDDCSTDTCASISREYSDRNSNVRLHVHIDNLGLCRTAMDAATLATSDYLIYLDQDDILPPRHIESMLRVIDPNVAFAFCNSVTIDEGGHPGPLLYEDALLVRNVKNARFQLAMHNFVNTCGLLLNRDFVMRAGGWDGRFRNYGHWLLLIKLLAYGEARFTTATRSMYRRHASSMTSSFTSRPVRADLQAYINYCRDYSIEHGNFRILENLVLRSLKQARHLKYLIWDKAHGISASLRATRS
jgi:glycosyltransferase involved in cell wall biosynthesis